MKQLSPAPLWRQALGVFRRQALKASIAFAVVIAAAIGYLVWSPLLYTSEAKVFVRLGRETIALDPTATTGQTVGVLDTRENEINSVQELLKSQAIIESIVDKLGPTRILDLPDNAVDPAEVEPAIWQRLNPLASYSQRDKAVRLLGKRFNVEAVHKSNVINISCDATNPELAKRIISLAIETAREIHLRVNRSDQSFYFFDAQTRDEDEKLSGLEEELRKLKDATGIAEIAEQRTILLDRLASLEGERLRAQAAFESTEAEVSSRAEALREIPTMQISAETSGQSQSTVSRLREQLYALELREKELTSKFQEDTFVVSQIRDQIAAAKRVLNQEVDPVQTTKSLNESHRQTHIGLLEGKAKAAALAAQIKVLDAQAAEARQAIQTFNANEVKIARLDRQIDLEKSTFRKFAENRELARIDRALQDQNISNLNVLQEPTHSITPTKPRVTLVLIFGFALASMAAVGVSVLGEARHYQGQLRGERDRLDESNWIDDPANGPFDTLGESHGDEIFRDSGRIAKKNHLH